MYILVEILTIFLSMITHSSGICTRNSKFNEVVKDPRTIFLCETNSSCTKRFLQDRENYYGCLIKGTNKVEPLSIYIHQLSVNNGSIVRVLVGDKWEKRKTTVHFYKIAYITTLLNLNEHFSVECGMGLKPARNQFPDLDQKKYQFPDYYKHLDNSIKQLYHSQILDCVSDCKENPIKVVRLDKFKDHTKVIGNSIHVDYANDPHVIYQNLLSFSCGGSTKKNEVTMNFKYAEHYNISIWDRYGQIGKIKIYDLWERFHCRISFLIMHNNMPVTSLHVSNIFIYMKVSSGPYSRSGYLTAWDTKTVVIDLNVSLFHQLDLMCYLGNHNGITDKSMKNTVWNFGVIETVTIKGKYNTKLLYDDWENEVVDTLEEGRIIKCDIDYLGKIATSYNIGEIRPFNIKDIRLSYITKHHGTHPLSKMIPSNPAQYTKIKYIITHNKKTYFFCFVDEYYSIPRVFQAVPPRTHVSIVNVFPPWNHTFSLPLFTYGCKAGQLTKYSWITVNPENKYDVIIENRSKSLAYLTISKNINRDKYLAFACTAKSKYGIETKSKQFKTIVNYQVQFNYKSKESFYLEGDRFGCIAVLNMSGSTGNLGHIIPMPATIDCDGWINSTDSNTTVLVLPTGLVQCFGCCSTFMNSKMVCETWKEIQIANSYRFQWNADLKNLYSGDFLTCSVCLNFTNNGKNQACIGNNNRLTNVGMRIRYSNSKVIEYPCFPDRFELVIPIIENGVKKVLINSSDLQINISCCFRDVIEITTVKVKSNFVFTWNDDLNEITPGKKLTCSVCHNLTNDNNVHHACTPSDKNFANVGMDIHSLDSRIMHIPCSSDRYEISLPAAGFFKTNLRPFQIDLKCCYENISETMSFREGCTAQVPYFVPPNKFLFRINDTVICTTMDETCVKFFIPEISLLGSKNKSTFPGPFYTFGDSDLGFRGTLRCRVPKETANILIIVQNQPYNLTIQFVKRLMVPGTNLTCTAKGYPEPTLRWIQMTGADEFRVVKNSLLIRLLDVSGIYLARCEARNYLGASEKIVTFEVFNPKALNHISSKWFFLYVPLMSLTAIFALFASLICTFQESIFGVPLFSTYKAYPTKLDLSKRSNKNKAIPDIGRQSFIAHTERLIQNNWLNNDD